MNAEQHEWYWRGYNDAKKQEHREFVGLTEAQCGVLWKTNMTPFEYYQAIRELIEYADLQQGSIPRSEFEKFIIKTKNYIKSHGDKVVEII